MEESAERRFSHAEEPAIAESKVILLIDDNADILELNRIVLELDGFKVFTARGGYEASKILSEIVQPDLILLDLKMQNMSGVDFLKVLEHEMPDLIKNVPVVFLTGAEDIPHSKATGIIKKPIADLGEFVLSLRRFIETGPGSSTEALKA